jgi:nitrate/nitrite-specific signal transduction histidine kinase
MQKDIQHTKLACIAYITISFEQFIKHADAKNIIIIVESNTNISIKIKDDGKGMGEKLIAILVMAMEGLI